MGGERYIDRKRNRKKKRKRAKRDDWAGRERKGKRKKRKPSERTKRGRGKENRKWTKRAVGGLRNRRRVEWAGKGMGRGNGVAREDREAWISAAGGVPEEREAPDGGCCIL